MPDFKIYLVDYTGSTEFTLSKKALLANRLKSLFDTITEGRNDFTTRILWELPSAILPNELICYFVLNPGKSIIKAKYSAGHGTDGFTRFNDADGSLSEVYFTKWKQFPTFLSDLVFHEFMHNKLEGGATKVKVHSDKKGFGQSSLFNDQSEIDVDNPKTPEDERLIPNYKLTGDNISNMLSAMRAEVKQVVVTQEEYDRMMEPKKARKAIHK